MEVWACPRGSWQSERTPWGTSGIASDSNAGAGGDDGAADGEHGGAASRSPDASAAAAFAAGGHSCSTCYPVDSRECWGTWAWRVSAVMWSSRS